MVTFTSNVGEYDDEAGVAGDAAGSRELVDGQRRCTGNARGRNDANGTGSDGKSVTLACRTQPQGVFVTR
jgi:hypothetical protein